MTFTAESFVNMKNRPASAHCAEAASFCAFSMNSAFNSIIAILDAMIMASFIITLITLASLQIIVLLGVLVLLVLCVLLIMKKLNTPGRFRTV